MQAITPDLILAPNQPIPQQRELTSEEALSAELNDVADSLLMGRCADGMRGYSWEILERVLHVRGTYVGSAVARTCRNLDARIMEETQRLIREGKGPLDADSIQIQIQVVNT